MSTLQGLEQYSLVKYEKRSEDKEPDVLKREYIHIQTIKKFLSKHEVEKFEDSPVVIKDLDFTVKKGELIGIVAQVGHGKTSFFNTLLGEMRLAP